MGEEDALSIFPCSWSDGSQEVSGHLRVLDCWAGLDMAVAHGWFEAACLETEDDTAQFCQDYLHAVLTYDVSQLVPGLLVSADPVTTARDPNPETFAHVFTPRAPAFGGSESGNRGTPAIPSSPGLRAVPMGDMDLPPDIISPLSPKSCDTVCKEYSGTPNAKSGSGSFVSFLKECGIGFIIRANFRYEHGMPSDSYNKSDFVSRGIRHLDLPVPDYGGSLPTTRDLRKLLNATEDCPISRFGHGIIIHCKGGFGRSVLFACHLIAQRFTVYGSALLGWVRMVRPGAVTTLQQEQYILDLGRGRIELTADKSSSENRQKPCTIS